MALSKKQIEDANKNLKSVKENKTKVGSSLLTSKPFRKPTSDYIRLDLVIRKKSIVAKENTSTSNHDLINNPGTYKGKVWNRQVITQDIEKDYKTYLEQRANETGLSVTKYIHNLIDADMEQNK